MKLGCEWRGEEEEKGGRGGVTNSDHAVAWKLTC